MTIKQLEEHLGIPRATVRFYEKENLIKPERQNNSYREYSDENVATLKKIIILRRIGISVSDIKKTLDGECTLQSLLDKNITDLENQIKELEGAINVSKTMQERNEDIFTLDENMYLEEINNLEKSGFRFKDILNDVIEFEKSVILKEFDLADYEGKPRYDLKESILRALGTCLLCGLMWYILEGKDRSVSIFLEGFFWPLISIIFLSILGLPVYFIGKKNPELAKKIKKIGKIAAVVITVAALITAIALICI